MFSGLHLGSLVGGRYRLERVLGEGGAGVVWAATDERLARPVAVKLLKPEAHRSETLLRRLLREARAASAIRHRAIVRIEEIVQDGARLGLVMELLEGETLQRRLARQGRFSVRDFAPLAIEAIGALATAHAIGIVHRDVKPENVFLASGAGGRIDVKVLDFGLAKLAVAPDLEGQATRLTQEGVVMGTPLYMSPEQASAEVDIDVRTDVWSFGMLLYRALSGTLPTDRATLAELRRVITVGPIAPLGAIAPDVPADVSAIVMRMLSIPRADRPSDLREVAEVLSRHAPEGEPSGAPSVEGREDAPFVFDTIEELGPYAATHGDATDDARAPLPFTGRDRELGSLVALYDECAGEHVARAVVITGEAGIGKSRLWTELRDRVSAGTPAPMVLVGRGDPQSPAAPFHALAGALRAEIGAFADDPPPLQHERLRARVARRVAASAQRRVADFLGEIMAIARTSAQSIELRSAREDRILMGDQMRRAWEDWLDAEAASRPVVIAIDDVQWADLPSLLFVDAALRRSRDRSLLVVALARPEVSEAFPDLWKGRAVLRLELAPLSPRASERLAAHVLGTEAPPGLASQIAARAAGHPLLLGELLRSAARETGPADALAGHTLVDGAPSADMARDAMDERIAALSPEARRVLGAASVLGETFRPTALSALLALPRHEANAAEALAPLVHAGLLHPAHPASIAGERQFAFAHALLRDAAYATVSAEDRKLLHRLAGEWLEAAGDADGTAIAAHYARGDAPNQARAWWRRAAEQALCGNDFSAAIEHAERAASGAPPEELAALRLSQAEAHRWRGEMALVFERAVEAVTLAQSDSMLSYTALAEAVVAAGRLHRLALSRSFAQPLLDALDAGRRGRPLLLAAARAAGSLTLVGEHAAGAELLARVDEAADTADDPALRARIFGAKGLHAGLPEISATCGMRAALSFERAGDARNACLARTNASFGLMELGAYAEAEETLRAALVEAERLVLPQVARQVTNNLGFVRFRQGHVEEALRIEEEALVEFERASDIRMAASTRIYLGLIALALGDEARAETLATRALELLEAGTALHAFARAVLAATLLAAGRLEDALREVALPAGLHDDLAPPDEGEAFARLTRAKVLRAASDEAGARSAMRAARARLVARAAAIQDEHYRRTFLENVPENAETLSLAGAWLDG